MNVNANPIFKFNYNQIYNHEFNFALLDENLRVVHTPFMCKDYLNDIFWSEYLNRKASVYGINWNSGSFNIEGPKFKLALLDSNILLRNHIKSFQTFLNIFDEALGFEKTVVSETDDDKIIVVEFDKKWTTCGPLLSAFTTLIRIGGNFSNEKPLEYLKRTYKEYRAGKLQPEYMHVEAARLENTFPKIAALLQGKKPTCDWSITDSTSSTHNLGIMNYSQFPSTGEKVTA